MPFRTMSTLESWLDEFREMGHGFTGSIRVIAQDGSDGSDTGLVALTLNNATTVISIHPERPYAPQWVATMEPREETMIMSPSMILALSHELAVIASLCAFLQAKSESFLERGVD